VPYEKFTWGKLEPDTPKYIIDPTRRSSRRWCPVRTRRWGRLMDMTTWLWLLLGLAALLVGAEFLVRGASRLATRVGISPLVVGLTIVAIGTSSPEIAVSVGASLDGQGDIALGNVIGSNIFNVLVILGLSALITPLRVQQQLVRLDVPLMVAVCILAWLLSLDESLGRIDGAVLFVIAIAYTVFLIVQSRRESSVAVIEEYANEFDPRGMVAKLPVQLAMIAVGLVMLVAGANWLVDAAVTMARALGVSELVIGLTIIAAGTSLPEVATSVLAAVRGERDIAVGNVVGSNLFNIMAVLGISSLVAPGGIPVAEAVRDFDLPVMIAVALACLPIFFTGNLVARWEGGLFLAYYVFYVAWLLLVATGSPLTETWSDAMTFFVIPLTFITLAVFGYREWTGRKVRH
jgi:cation:H+ antiporter